MALVQFSCRATGPFLMFPETVKQIFKVIGCPFKERGAFAADELPAILAILDRAQQADKERLAELEQERERQLKACTYNEELELKAKFEEQKAQEKVHLFQRIVPLQDMIRRAIKKEEPIMWETL